MFTAGIVGAGIIGRLLAYQLVHASCSVAIFDQDNEQGLVNCSMAAAGLLNPVTELENCGALIYHLGSESVKKRWPEIIQQLGESIFFHNTGSIAVAHPRDQVELKQFINVVSKRVPQQDFYQVLNPTELQHLEPELTKFTHDSYLLSGGQIDNQAIMQALGAKLRLPENNVLWNFNAHVIDLKPGEIVLAAGSKKFDIVFDCRGLGAKEQFRDLRGIRGELLWLHAPDVHIKHPVHLFHPRYNIYLAPRPEQVYLVGASEIEAEDMSAISVRTVLELLSGTYYLHSSFGEARVIKSVVQCRPTLPNHLPKIKYSDGLIAINGLYRHGFLLAPVLIDEVLRLVQKGVAALQYPELSEKIV